MRRDREREAERKREGEEERGRRIPTGQIGDVKRDMTAMTGGEWYKLEIAG